MDQSSSGSRSLASCLGIGCGVLLVLILIASVGGYFLRDQIRDGIANEAYGDLAHGLESSVLDEDERAAVLSQLRRLRDGVKDGEVGFGELNQLLRDFGESPIQALLVTSDLRRLIAGSGDFSEAEQQAAEITLRRYWEARLAGRLERGDDADLVEALGLKAKGKGIHVTIQTAPKVQDIRAALVLAEEKLEPNPAVESNADAAGAPANPGADAGEPLSKMIRDLLDPVLESGPTPSGHEE